MNGKKLASLILTVILIFVLAACGVGSSAGTQSQGTQQTAPKEKDITVEPSPEDATEISAHIKIFASDSAIYFISMASDAYSGFRPAMTTAILLDENVVLTEKILSGYDCDIFITDDPFFMNFIDKDGGDENQYHLDLIVEGSRTELFKYHDEESDTTIVWEAAILKQSVCPADCQQFIDWMKDEMDESIYTQCSVTKP